MGIVLGGAADRCRRTVQGFDHPVELGGDLGEFGDLVARHKAAGRTPMLADLPRQPGKSAQSAIYAEQG